MREMERPTALHELVALLRAVLRSNRHARRPGAVGALEPDVVRDAVNAIADGSVRKFEGRLQSVQTTGLAARFLELGLHHLLALSLGGPLRLANTAFDGGLLLPGSSRRLFVSTASFLQPSVPARTNREALDLRDVVPPPPRFFGAAAARLTAATTARCSAFVAPAALAFSPSR